MDPEMITAIRSGDGDQIRKLGKEKPDLFTKTSPQGNTVLHIAARYGNSSVVNEILEFRDSFLFHKNRKGETPFHVAIISSNQGVIVTLLHYQGGRANGEIGEANILRIRDDEGNIPLHIAVKNNNFFLVKDMLDQDPELVRFDNEAGQYPLSIAIDSGFFESAYWILNKGPEDYHHEGNHIKLYRALILRKENDYFPRLLWREESHVHDLDDKYRNLLHYAAVAGNDYVTKALLLTNSLFAYERDCYGQTPLHLAARNGHLISLKNLINTCPDATEVLDKENRNIFHTAAQYGQVNIILYLLKIRELKDFINSCDKDGNTPLHLATMNFNIGVINILSKNDKVRIRATNKKNQTALQVVVEASEDPKTTFQKHLTIKALKAAYAHQALEAEDILENSHFKGISNIDGNSGHKEMAQTLSVIGTLVATFTFTAAFTIPGGFISDGQDQGLATLARKPAFQAFVVTDTIAMTSSMSAAMLVFWTFWRRGSESFMDALPLAIGLIWIGLVSMTIAFVTGLFVVLSKNLTLAIVACCIGCALPFIFYVVAPLSPLLLSNSGLAQTKDNPFAFTLRMVKMLFLKLLAIIWRPFGKRCKSDTLHF